MFSLLPLSRSSLAPIMGLGLDDFYNEAAAALSYLDPSGTSQYEQNNSMVFEFGLSGYEAADIKISVDKDKQLLKVTAASPSYPNRKYVYNSLNNKNTSYTISLRSGNGVVLDYAAATTTFENGVLKIEMPKLTKPKSSEITLEIK